MSKGNLQDNLESFHEHGFHLPSRTIFIGNDAFSDEKTEQIIKNIYCMDRLNQPITVIIMSEGGDVYNARGIYDAILGCKNEVTAICYAKVMSSATLILQACDYRFLAPNTKFMVHIGQDSYPEDHPDNIENWYKANKEIRKWMENIYLQKIKEKHPRYTKAKLDKLLQFDTILNSGAAIELGLADKIY